MPAAFQKTSATGKPDSLCRGGTRRPWRWAFPALRLIRLSGSEWEGQAEDESWNIFESRTRFRRSTGHTRDSCAHEGTGGPRLAWTLRRCTALAGRLGVDCRID